MQTVSSIGVSESKRWPRDKDGAFSTKLIVALISDDKRTLKYIDVVKIEPLQASFNTVKDVFPTKTTLVDVALLLSFGYIDYSRICGDTGAYEVKL